MQQALIFNEYKATLKQLVKLYYPPISDQELDPIIDYSISKRYKEYPVELQNNYTHQTKNMNLLALIEYILNRQPIISSAGTLFKNHEDGINPLTTVIQQFLDARGIHKKEMFKYPKGSENFEYYNLLQTLDKIDSNGIYGTIGMYTSLIYNINVASSVTTNGRAAVSHMILWFEMFLNNNVKFGSLNEVLEFINHIVEERPKRKYSEYEYIDQQVSVIDCFSRIIYTCGYRWVPNDEEMEIIWRVVNNLFGFIANSKIESLLIKILETLDYPYLNPLKCPKEIKDDLDFLVDLLKEFVYYRYEIIDRMDRNDNMIKSVAVISDTDSAIVSLDGWFRYVHNLCIEKNVNIKFWKWAPKEAVFFLEYDEFGDIKYKSKLQAIFFEDPYYYYDFQND